MYKICGTPAGVSPSTAQYATVGVASWIISISSDSVTKSKVVTAWKTVTYISI